MQRLARMSASSDTNYANAGRMCHNALPPPLPPTPPPPPTTPYSNPSIARFICVSHYRKWNVVPAKCINSEVGKLACCTPCSRYGGSEGQEKAERTGRQLPCHCQTHTIMLKVHYITLYPVSVHCDSFLVGLIRLI